MELGRSLHIPRCYQTEHAWWSARFNRSRKQNKAIPGEIDETRETSIPRRAKKPKILAGSHFGGIQGTLNLVKLKRQC